MTAARRPGSTRAWSVVIMVLLIMLLWAVANYIGTRGKQQWENEQEGPRSSMTSSP